MDRSSVGGSQIVVDRLSMKIPGGHGTIGWTAFPCVSGCCGWISDCSWWVSGGQRFCNYTLYRQRFVDT